MQKSHFLILIFLVSCTPRLLATPVTPVPLPAESLTPTDTVPPGNPETGTPACETHAAALEIEASSPEVRAGETLTLTLTLRSTGCAPLGLPQYSLHLPAEGAGAEVFSLPDPVVHSLAVPPGGEDQAQLALAALAPGAVTLTARANFEVHLGYPGPAYWAGVTSPPVTLTVLP